MNIEQLWGIFKDLGPSGLSLNHYELAQKTKVKNPEQWKEFLLDQEVSNWIKTELSLIRDSELNKMINGINDSNSVGKAQLMNAISKLSENKGTKDGPVFVYCYIPLSKEQENAPNVAILNSDPFLD